MCEQWLVNRPICACHCMHRVLNPKHHVTPRLSWPSPLFSFSFSIRFLKLFACALYCTLNVAVQIVRLWRRTTTFHLLWPVSIRLSPAARVFNLSIKVPDDEWWPVSVNVKYRPACWTVNFLTKICITEKIFSRAHSLWQSAVLIVTDCWLHQETGNLKSNLYISISH